MQAIRQQIVSVSPYGAGGRQSAARCPAAPTSGPEQAASTEIAVSLDIARNIAFSGLWATQVQISVASANIANADTKGYTEKTANQASSITSGVGTGVTVTGITSTVDKLLLKSLIGANSDLGSAGTVTVI